MIVFLTQLLHVVVSPFRTKARLEAEIILLRHQLNVLRRRVPSNPKLAVARPIGLCLALSPVSVGVERCDNCPTGDRHSMASDGLSTVLALEVTRSRWAAEGSGGDPPVDPGDEPGQPAVGSAAKPR
jgi:hypothetical protein